MEGQWDRANPVFIQCPCIQHSVQKIERRVVEAAMHYGSEAGPMGAVAGEKGGQSLGRLSSASKKYFRHLGELIPSNGNLNLTQG